MLSYRDIRLWKMKFLFRVIETFFEKFKYLKNPMEFLKFFSYSGRASPTRAATPQPWVGGFIQGWAPRLGVLHLGFTNGYHSSRGCHGNGPCCHGNNLFSHGTWAFCITWPTCDHVTRTTRVRPCWLLWCDAEPPVFHTTHRLSLSIPTIPCRCFSLGHQLSAQKGTLAKPETKKRTKKAIPLVGNGWGNTR